MTDSRTPSRQQRRRWPFERSSGRPADVRTPESSGSSFRRLRPAGGPHRRAGCPLGRRAYLFSYKESPMPRVIVTTNLPPSGEPAVLLDEHLSTVHLSSDHAAAQLIERLSWAIRDAERTELDRLARPLIDQQERARARTRRVRAGN